MSQAVIRGLRNRGIDVLTVPDAEMLGATDDLYLALARRESRVLFTQDADFLRLAAAGAAHAGIVYAHQQTPTGRIVRGLVLIHQVLSAEEMVGKVEFV